MLSFTRSSSKLLTRERRKTRSKQELQQLECQGQEEAREVYFGKQAPQLIRLSERAGTYYLQAETGQQTYGHLIVSHIYSLLVKSTKRAFTGEIATSSTPLLLPVLNQVQVKKKKDTINTRKEVFFFLEAKRPSRAIVKLSSSSCRARLYSRYSRGKLARYSC